MEQKTSWRTSKSGLRSAHNQVELEVHGELIAVDKGVVELVKLMNSLPGVVTFNSCQGGDIEHDAYVQFGGDGAFFLLAPLAHAIFREHEIWTRKHRHICMGCRSMSIALHVDGNGFALRWAPWDYRRAVRIITSLKKVRGHHR
jgi:hypothetical protein